MAPVNPKLLYFTAYGHRLRAMKTRPSMKILGHQNVTKIYKNLAPVDPKLTFFTTYGHGTKKVKTRPSMKILGHGNGTKIHKTWPLSIQN